MADDRIVNTEESSVSGDSSRDTVAYKTYRPEDDPRNHCDHCSACEVYNCSGITARHHFIHLNLFEYFQQSDEDWERGMLRNSDRSEHSDRDSGMLERGQGDS
jgi:hypothetical protein